MIEEDDTLIVKEWAQVQLVEKWKNLLNATETRDVLSWIWDKHIPVFDGGKATLTDVKYNQMV